MVSLSSIFAPRLRHENGRSAHFGTGGLVKNALAPSATSLRPFSLPPPLPPCPRVSPGKVFQTLKMHDIARLCSGAKLVESISTHTSRIFAFACVRAASSCCTYSGERWEFLYERRADKGNEERDKHCRCRYFIKIFGCLAAKNFDSIRCFIKLMDWYERISNS
jgi:hypothetical protein